MEISTGFARRERRQKRFGIRKFGADMTNALLYAAFAAVIFIAGMKIYEAVDLNARKHEASVVMTGVSEALKDHRTFYALSYDGEDAAEISDAIRKTGMVPDKHFLNVAGGAELSVPYGGVLSYMIICHKCGVVYITFMEPTRKAAALCTYLSSGPMRVLRTGPLGTDYSVNDKNCDVDGGPLFVSLSYRDIPPFIS